MIRRHFTRRAKGLDALADDAPRGFDAYDLRLGDLMRGERATLGKSLLDVERELRIRAAYIAAIENADPTAFDTPGFIPGYVRSYARYLGMDPDRTFQSFCDESGFSIAHGMSAEASSVRRIDQRAPAKRRPAPGADPLVSPKTPFLPARESWFAGIEPGALGSGAVLLALIAALGYGGWSVLREVQRVQLSPVESAPDVLADLDPLQDAAVGGNGTAQDLAGSQDANGGANRTAAVDEDKLDDLYRPKALEVPVMVARDAPISTLDPRKVGTLGGAALPDADRRSFSLAEARAVADGGDVQIASAGDSLPVADGTAEGATNGARSGPKVMADTPPGLRLIAVRPAWVRVRAGDGTVIYEGILNAGDSYQVPASSRPPTLRVGASGAVYFAVGDKHYGPVGPRGAVTSGVTLAADAVKQRFALANPIKDRDLLRYVAELRPEDTTGN